MNITIKQLQGGECNVQVHPTTKILEIKKHISTKLQIPIAEQKLLLIGRTLADGQTVESYPQIKNGTKLNLVVKKPQTLLEVSTKYFKKQGMTEAEARNAGNRLLKVVEEKFNKLSWDDIERLSLDCMLEECGHPQPSIEQEQDNECEDAFGL